MAPSEGKTLVYGEPALAQNASCARLVRAYVRAWNLATAAPSAAERTREAVVEALLSLLDEGELSPTAERVAERAAVSERSVFQHFSDREALFGAAATGQFERVAPQLDRSTPPCR